MSNYTHYADMSYGYDTSGSGAQYPTYDQYYDQQNLPPATGEMQTGPQNVSMFGYGRGVAGKMDTSDDPYANEPPLLEELEINLDQIMQKTWAVLTFKNLNDHRNILHEPDLAGPVAFLLTFGFLLLLTGKIQFGYIYGLGTLGCLIIYFVVYLISSKSISFMCTVSVLGYCLLPMVILSGLSIMVNLRATLVGSLLSVVAILWCAIGATNLLVTALDVSNSRLTIAYPCTLLYTVFALLTVF